jgi:prepilin-type N-terminal cleavage/methylation domain-containing protein
VDYGGYRFTGVISTHSKHPAYSPHALINMAGSGTSSLKSGFTLIELSIVLVIIGLLVGGILTGQSLIDAAAQRAQVTQITKYNTAVNTFRNKYGGLPGDLQDPQATQFGFQSRGQYAGEGDGNGILEGNCGNQAGWNRGGQQGCGELAVFWQDLSTAGLIDTNVPTGANYPSTTSATPWTSLSTMPSIKSWLPEAKLGNGQFIYVMSLNGNNYFVVQLVQAISWAVESTGGYPWGRNAMTVQQAYNIDTKIDDGLPQSGSVTACDNDADVQGVNNTYQPVWAAGLANQGAGGLNCVPTTAATPYASTNCFDNNNVAGTQTYSISQNANQQNCALSFRFQ